MVFNNNIIKIRSTSMLTEFLNPPPTSFRRYRPLYKELSYWPALNLEGSRFTCPFAEQLPYLAAPSPRSNKGTVTAIASPVISNNVNNSPGILTTSNRDVTDNKDCNKRSTVTTPLSKCFKKETPVKDK